MLGSQNHSVLRRHEGCRHKAKPIACKCNNPSYLSAEWDRKTVPERRHTEINCAFLNHHGGLRSDCAAEGWWQNSPPDRRNSEKPTDLPVAPPSHSCCRAASPGSAAPGSHS